MAGILEGLDERLGRVETLLGELIAKVDSNGHGEVGWFDLKAAAVYLSMTPQALKQAELRGDVEGVRTGNGRVRFERAALDKYATSGNGRR